jgi:hypothetical protein
MRGVIFRRKNHAISYIYSAKGYLEKADTETWVKGLYIFLPTVEADFWVGFGFHIVLHSCC